MSLSVHSRRLLGDGRRENKNSLLGGFAEDSNRGTGHGLRSEGRGTSDKGKEGNSELHFVLVGRSSLQLL